MSFKSCRSYWDFQKSVVFGNRFFFDKDTKSFLDVLLETSESRKKSLEKGTILYRSQIGKDIQVIKDDLGNYINEVSHPYQEGRMLPRTDMVGEGRANPKGVLYLYLASCKETSMSEVRPWVGAEISLAKFRISRDLTLVDCSVNTSSTLIYFKVDEGLYEPDENEKRKSVWAHVDKAFSSPVNPNESHTNYVTTQVIAELFKTNGIDGIVYRSMLGPNCNVVLFDMQSAEFVGSRLYSTNSVKFEFSESG